MSKILKSLFFLILTIFGLFALAIKTSFAKANENTYFIVTAYYSPLPNQKHYITGSYSGDKRLNGEGHTTASGKPVKPGILAAPSKYPFGTKIYFEGYGVGTVEDRGGAIVKAGVRGHEHDRIDIWMGYGDEGLQRALKWGTRTISGRVVSRNQEVNLKFAKDILTGLEKIKVNPEIHKNEDVIILQEKFKELGLYNGKIDGKYESIKKDLIDFQIKNKIISSYNDESAGYFGPKTYTALLRKFGSKEVLIKQDDFVIQETNPKIEIILEAPEIKLNGDNPQIEEVKKLQELFKKLGLYNGNIDGNYNSIKNKILEIQKQAGIIRKDNDWGAGYFGEKTKAALIKYCEDKYQNKSLQTTKEINKTISLNENDIAKLNKITIKIQNFIKKKSGIDTNRKKILTNKIKEKLEKIKIKTKKEKIKIMIDYLIKNI